jgi:hypothetical protein
MRILVITTQGDASGLVYELRDAERVSEPHPGWSGVYRVLRYAHLPDQHPSEWMGVGRFTDNENTTWVVLHDG